MGGTLALKSDGVSRIDKILNTDFNDCKVVQRVNSDLFISGFSQSLHTTTLTGALIFSQIIHVTQDCV